MIEINKKIKKHFFKNFDWLESSERFVGER
jgi:hypothetical protein